MAVNARRWIETLVRELRRQVRSQPNDVVKRVFWTVDPPCQMEMFDFADPSHTLRSQVTFITHFDDLPDLKIDYHGPLTMSEALSNAENLLASHKWERPLTTNVLVGTTSCREVAEAQLVRAVESLRGAVESWLVTGTMPGPALTGGQNLGADDRAMYSRGDFCSLDPAVEAERIVQQARDRVERRTRRAREVRPKPQTLAGVYAFFYPPVWVGRAPEPSLAERIRGSRFAARPATPVPATDLHVADRLLVLYEDGSFFLEEEDALEALKLINRIMAFLLQCGLSCESLTEGELGTADIDDQSRKIVRSHGSLGSLRNILAMAPDQHGLRHIRPFSQRVEAEALSAALAAADPHVRSQTTAELLGRSGEAWTHFQRSEHTEAFILAWTLIERNIQEIWQSHVRGRGITGDRRKKLEQSLTWTVDHQLETLQMCETLTADDYSLLDRLRRRRNAIVHRLEGASEEEAELCLDRALTYVRSKLGVVPLIEPERIFMR